jgi:hypothetical protein
VINSISITVGINPRLSDSHTRTSKLSWRYFEAHKIDSNKLQIHTNLQKGTGTKMAEKFKKFKKFEKKKKKKKDFSPALNPDTS